MVFGPIVHRGGCLPLIGLVHLSKSLYRVPRLLFCSIPESSESGTPSRVIIKKSVTGLSSGCHSLFRLVYSKVSPYFYRHGILHRDLEIQMQ
jgi:hypothetical protein